MCTSPSQFSFNDSERGAFVNSDMSILELRINLVFPNATYSFQKLTISRLRNDLVRETKTAHAAEAPETCS